mmetsp:Transcript_73341/g.184877  ORF Transcript_73341/g.184877 Transcript_73341/m.184877 type:complete len:116 (-) Transcript_73341:19-366(-)
MTSCIPARAAMKPITLKENIPVDCPRLGAGGPHHAKIRPRGRQTLEDPKKTKRPICLSGSGTRAPGADQMLKRLQMACRLDKAKADSTSHGQRRVWPKGFSFGAGITKAKGQTKN